MPIIILPDESAVFLPPSYDSFGFEAFGNQHQTSQSTTPQAAYPPPSYEVFEMYPLFPSTENQTETYGISDYRSSDAL